jgi:hypothetical protein
MKTKLLSAFLGCVLALNSAASLADEDKGPSPAVIEQLNVVNKLIALGDARKDPLLLLAAASLQKSMGAEVVSAPMKSTAPEDVLDRAKTLAAGRKDLIAIADDMAAVKSKGPTWQINAVTGRSTYRY